MRVSIIMLAIWLCLWGLLSISNFNFDASKTVMGLLAIATGIALVVERFFYGRPTP